MTQFGRIYDVNFNRACEAARVIEEYFRFEMDLFDFAAKLKNVRHTLRDIVKKLKLDVSTLVGHRDITGDVGTAMMTPQELSRGSVSEVLRANFNRLRESLRVFEEYSKTSDIEAAKTAKALRYEVYDIEKTAFRLIKPQSMLENALLYVIVTQKLCSRKMTEVVRETIKGGADIIQLREKEMCDREFLDQARRVRDITASGGALFIVNDRVDIAQIVHADGVHVGQDDLSVAAVRRIVGEEKIVGVSTHTIDQARIAEREGAGYIGAGPLYPTKTKVSAEAVGIEFVSRVVREITIPFYVIGSINETTIHDVIEQGAHRVSICSAIISASDVYEKTRFFKEILTQASVS